MTVTTVGFTEKKQLGDVFRSLWRQDYSLQAARVYNRSGGAITISDICGYPVKADGGGGPAGSFQFAAGTADEAYVTGLIYKQGLLVSALANNGYITVPVLVRGIAIVDKTQIPTVDYAAVAFVLATIVTALKAFNPPVLANAENTNTGTQTT